MQQKSRSELVRLLDEHALSDLEDIKEFFKSFSLGFSLMKRIHDKSNLKMPQKYDDVGFPGTLSDASMIAAASIHTVYQGFANIGDSLSATIEGPTTTLRCAWIEKIKPLLPELYENLDKINSIDEVLNNFIGKNSQISAEFGQMTAKIMNNQAPSTKELAAYQAGFEKVAAARKKINKQRMSLISTAQTALDKIDVSLTNFLQAYRTQYSTLLEMFNWFAFAYDDFSKKIEHEVQELKKVESEIDFKTDFSNFVEAKKLVRYDMRPLPFEEIDLSGPAFADLNLGVPVFPTPMYPIALAYIKQSYTPSGGQNELKIVKGKRILMMENNELDWTYVMHPISHKMGYVPSSYLDKITTKMGVLLRQPKNVDELALRIGDFVGVIEEPDQRDYLIETTQGKRGLISKANIGIIFS